MVENLLSHRSVRILEQPSDYLSVKRPLDIISAYHYRQPGVFHTEDTYALHLSRKASLSALNRGVAQP